MGPLQKLLQETKFVHQLQGRRVDGVTAEVAQEIGMLLKDDSVDPGTGEQKPQHHAGRTPTGDAATSLELRIHQGFPLEKDYGIGVEVSNQPLELFT
jgi:hypothetical protein